jgi:DNA adenine methylase
LQPSLPLNMSAKLPAPVIKWAGSKRRQSHTIASLAPTHHRYVEAFVGGGAVLYRMAPSRGLASDICGPLIGFWRLLQTDLEALISAYRREWQILQEEGPDHYYRIRDRFNEDQDPCDLLFLSRTCVNGLIRFNQDGEFNNSFHLSRPGIRPERLARTAAEWAARIKETEFVHQDYRETLAACGEGDFVYLDPPYFHTKGRYYGSIEATPFFQAVEAAIERGAAIAMSYDGVAGDQEYEAPVPDRLFKVQLSLEAGNSPFRKVQAGYVAAVRESLYLSYDPS